MQITQKSRSGVRFSNIWAHLVRKAANCHHSPQKRILALLKANNLEPMANFLKSSKLGAKKLRSGACPDNFSGLHAHSKKNAFKVHQPEEKRAGCPNFRRLCILEAKIRLEGLTCRKKMQSASMNSKFVPTSVFRNF